ncbi:hypothetical protein V1505DRAFT_53614 [Lipomyces doorenjongii]
MVHLGWNFTALCDQFYDGLRDHIKGELSMALRIDSRHMGRQLEKGRSFVARATYASASTAEPEPMQLDVIAWDNRDRRQTETRTTFPSPDLDSASIVQKRTHR